MSDKSEEICEAAKNDKVKQVKRIIRENPELVNDRDKLKWTPLHVEAILKRASKTLFAIVILKRAKCKPVILWNIII